MESVQIMRSGERFDWIDTIRGVAALLVFISHLPLDMKNETFVIGRIGVVIFFIVSGYLSVSSRKKMSGKRYLFNRFIRIYPLYWIFLVLTCVVTNWRKLFTWKFIANATCFEDFLGQAEIIGASWMLPIQISFFLLVGFFGVDFLAGKDEKDKRNVVVAVVMGIFAFSVSLLRYVTNKPFPTAFFLLINMGILGICVRKVEQGQIARRRMLALIGIFEAVLFVSVFFSYRDMFWLYIGAYNAGLAFAYAARKLRVSWKPFRKLSSIGFSFFLGGDIPYVFLSQFVDFEASIELKILGVALKFVLALLFAYVVTRYVEAPLQKWKKGIEKAII